MMRVIILSILFLLSAPSSAEREVLKPGSTFRDCEKCPEMVVVPKGQGMIGVHPKQKGYPAELEWQAVSIDYNFAVGKFELLNEEYQVCVEAGACEALVWSQVPQFESFPAVYLRWIDAKAYVDWLAKKTDKPYRLLTEVEWEYAARGGTETAFWWGDEFQTDMVICRQCMSDLGEKSGFLHEGSQRFNFSLNGTQYPFPWRDAKIVGPNPFGLFHMAGNASEWVQDCLKPVECQVPDRIEESAPEERPSRVIRGNDFDDRIRRVRLSRRSGYEADKIPFSEIGTRIALTLELPEQDQD